MSVDPTILERIKKVLKLAERGATPGEMEAAMARAREMAIRYQIDLKEVQIAASQDDIKIRKGPSIEKNGMGIATSFERPFHLSIYMVLTACFGIEVVRSTYKQGSRTKVQTLWFIGEATDVAIAQEIFKWLEQMFPKLFNEYVREGRLYRMAAHKNSFYNGLAYGIIAVNKKEEEKLSSQDRSKWALVVADKRDKVQAAMKEMFPDMVVKESRQKSSYDARKLGEARGKQINLNQMNSSATKKGELELK